MDFVLGTLNINGHFELGTYNFESLPIYPQGPIESSCLAYGSELRARGSHPSSGVRV